MRRIYIVAVREFLEMLKTKAFLLGVFVVPIVMVGALSFTGRLQKKMVSGPQETRTVAVTDHSGELGEEIGRLLEEHNKWNTTKKVLVESIAPPPEGLEGLTKRTKERGKKRELVGYLVVPQDVLGEAGRAQYYSRGDNLAELNVFHTVRNALNNAATNTRCVRRGISPQVIKDVRRKIPVDNNSVTAKPGKKQGGLPVKMMVPFFFMLLMFAGTVGANQHLLTSVIEEKNSRVIEVILSSVSPFQFMAGKILGLSAVSLMTVCIWGLVAYGTAAYHGMGDIVNTANIGFFLIYFVLGFLLFSSIFAAIGSACNTLKEAQSFMMPVMMVLMVPMMGWLYFSQHPMGVWAVALSFIPPVSPMVMILRLAARPDLPPLQIAASIILLAASVPLVMWVSARIFRVGILMYGKPASLRELHRWLRQK